MSRPRIPFTIQRLMIAIAGIAVLLWLPTLAWPLSVSLVYGVPVAGGAWRSAIGRPLVAI